MSNVRDFPLLHLDLFLLSCYLFSLIALFLTLLSFHISLVLSPYASVSPSLSSSLALLLSPHIFLPCPFSLPLHHPSLPLFRPTTGHAPPGQNQRPASPINQQAGRVSHYNPEKDNLSTWTPLLICLHQASASPPPPPPACLHIFLVLFIFFYIHHIRLSSTVLLTSIFIPHLPRRVFTSLLFFFSFFLIVFLGQFLCSSYPSSFPVLWLLLLLRLPIFPLLFFTFFSFIIFLHSYLTIPFSRSDFLLFPFLIILHLMSFPFYFFFTFLLFPRYLHFNYFHFF